MKVSGALETLGGLLDSLEALGGILFLWDEARGPHLSH